ncbi:MAG: DEAD/DEAH box helicase, partial [Robiginitalea sp.]
VENSADIYDARILAKMLQEEIHFRIKQYSYCIMNNTQNYRDWLQEDYERRLRLRVSQLYASRL